MTALHDEDIAYIRFSGSGRMRYPILALAAAVAFGAAHAAAGEGPVNWPRFRGPNGAGVAEGVALPARWTDGDYLWKVRLTGGGGHSSPVVWGGRVFVTSSDQQTAARTIQCLKAEDGSTLWTKTYQCSPCKQNPLNAYAATTPALDAERLYLSWATPERYVVVALTHEGEEVWRQNLGPWESWHGYGGSPMVVGDRVILANDQRGPSSIVALDAATGKVCWKTERPGKDKAAYSVPCLYRREDGSRQIIVTSKTAGVAGLDAATGRLLWQVADAMPQRVVSSPVVAGDLVLATCGTGGKGKHVIAIRPPTANGGKPEVTWKVTKDAPYVPTPVVHGGRVFLWTDSGVVSCVRADTGEHVWHERVGGGTYYASPIVVGQRLYNTSVKGEMVVLAAGDRYTLLARNNLGEKCQATPAVAGGRMFLRTWSHVMALPAEK